MIPNGQKYKNNKKYDDVFDRILTAFDFNDYYHPRDLRQRANVLFGKNNDLTDEDRYVQSQQAATMNILVRDVLFAYVPAQSEGEEDLCGFLRILRRRGHCASVLYRGDAEDKGAP